MPKYKLNLEEIELSQDRLANCPTWESLIEAGILIPVEEKEWPDIGDFYYFLDSEGRVGTNGGWENDRVDNWRKKTGNCFRTQKEAEAYHEQVMNS